MSHPVVGVIHATPLSMAPVTQAMHAEFPSARIRHLLDDSLLADLRAAGRVTADLDARMRRLVRHLVADDVDAVQLACSGYAATVDAVRDEVRVPVAKPDEAMYASIIAAGHRRVGIAATAATALQPASAQLRGFAERAGLSVHVASVAREEGMEAAQAGEERRLTDLVIEMVHELVAGGADAVALAQYSMSPAADEAGAAVDVPVYTGPRSAARRLRRLLDAADEQNPGEAPP